MISVEWVKLMLVLVILGRAVYTDVKQGVIENRNVMFGLLSGLICAFTGNGMEGVWQSVKMAGVMLVVLFILFVVKGLGAGDIKLFCVLAVFYPMYCMEVVIVSFLVAAVASIGKMVIRLIRKNSFYIRGETINFSIPIACGTLFVLWRGMI